MALRVLHLTGSAVSAFRADLSRLRATNCLAALNDPERYEPVLAYVGPDRLWRFPAALDRAGLADADPVTTADAVAHIATLEIDLALPQMFCRPAMTEYRALLDRLEIPYIGNVPDVSALIADRARTRAIVSGAGVGVPEGEVVHTGIRVRIAAPAVVKPVDGENARGVTLVREPSEFDRAVALACEHGSAALVERLVPLGREVRCATLVREGELICLPLKDRARARIIDPDDPVTAPVWEAARRCHEALGCRQYGLFDFRVDPEGRPWFLEAGLSCSFAGQSEIAVMAAAAGLPVGELFAQCAADALAAHRVLAA